MYRYFVSFTHMSDEQKGCGNVILEANHKINDFSKIEDMQKWIKDIQKWIEDSGKIENVIIMSFQLIE